jgi:hypothetical protein
MKKFILLAIAALFTFIATAQVKIDSGDPYISLKYKRTIVNGNTVMIYFVMTNLKNIEFEACLYNFVNLTFTDDEGNIYGNQNFKIDVGNSGKETGVFSPEIPLKVRFILTNINEYATAITSINYPYYYISGPGNIATHRTMKIYNIPIPRE